MKHFVLLSAVAVFFAVMPLSSCKGDTATNTMRAVNTSSANTDANTDSHHPEPHPNPTVRKTFPVVIDVTPGTHPNKRPEAIPPNQPLKIGSGTQIKWIIVPQPQNHEFTIRFDKDGSPFGTAENPTTVFTQDTPETGLPRDEIAPGEEKREYHYTVEVPGFKPLDPIVIIWK